METLQNRIFVLAYVSYYILCYFCWIIYIGRPNFLFKSFIFIFIFIVTSKIYVCIFKLYLYLFKLTISFVKAFHKLHSSFTFISNFSFLYKLLLYKYSFTNKKIWNITYMHIHIHQSNEIEWLRTSIVEKIGRGGRISCYTYSESRWLRHEGQFCKFCLSSRVSKIV